MSRRVRAARKPRPNRHRHFRSFWALLYREAAYTLLVGRFGFPEGQPPRAFVWRLPKSELHKLVARIITVYPERSIRP